MGDEPGGDLPEAAQRELAARRRELEREFNLKRADLKAQHQRRLDLLRQEQADWQEHRRLQAKELADRTEKVRRNAGNAQQRAELGAAERQELAELREQVKRLERAQREAKRTQTRLEEGASAADRRLRSARARASWAAAVLVLGALAWIALGWREARGLGVLAAALAGSVTLSLSAGRGLPRRRG
jgi:hypothetical protein